MGRRVKTHRHTGALQCIKMKEHGKVAMSSRVRGKNRTGEVLAVPWTRPACDALMTCVVIKSGFHALMKTTFYKGAQQAHPLRW